VTRKDVKMVKLVRRNIWWIFWWSQFTWRSSRHP